jgi:non-canonical (house-cleaning) NTP pyrophosphatase
MTSGLRPADSLARLFAGGVVRVGTENRAKLEAVRQAILPFREDDAWIEVLPCAAESGVPEQPIGFAEIMAGARQRARVAFESGPCDLAIGIEDGLARLSDLAWSESAGDDVDELSDVYNVGCAWLYDGTREGHGFSSGFAYPPACVAPAWRDRAPIGDVFDAQFRAARLGSGAASSGSGPATDAPSGRSIGNIGMLTGGHLERAAYGAQAVVCGLVRFLHTDLYD